jgi:Ca-activated chloride channel family protein
MITFANPWCLLLLLIIPAIIAYYVYNRKRLTAEIRFSTIKVFQEMPKNYKHYLRYLPLALHMLALAALIIAIARPQKSDSWSNQTTEGIDIVMSVDISSSMLAEDLKPNRLRAAKKVATEFISSRRNDNIGLVVFAGESFTQCPLTTDQNVLLNLFESVQFGTIEDGTAIGLGLANAVNRMKDSSSKSKVVILLTDGSNNRGDIDPLTAAEIAKTYGIRVYAIGVGSYQKQVRVPVYTPYGVQYTTMSSEFDESTLREIAKKTGGEYFRAKDNNTLRAIYSQIDQLEKTKMRVQEYSKRYEYFMPFLIVALICLLLELVLRYFVLRTLAE